MDDVTRAFPKSTAKASASEGRFGFSELLGVSSANCEKRREIEALPLVVPSLRETANATLAEMSL